MINRNTFPILIVLVLFIFTTIFVSCEDNYQPKPRGFFRIEMPEKNYVRFQEEGFPYSFSMPSFAIISTAKTQNEKYWINVNYPVFNAKLHISYKPIDNNLGILLNDMHKMMNKHIPKANAINEQMYLNKERQVYGITYDIKGSEAASPFQFYLTDSTKHFFRAALYFNFSPNNDSLEPVIDYLKDDLQLMIESFEWK